MTVEKGPQRLKCERHGAIAGWECTACHQPLCPDCATTKVIPPTSITACTLCGEFAEPLLQKKGTGASFTERLALMVKHGSTFSDDGDLDSYEPILKDTKPRGVMPEKERTLPKHLPSAIELEPEQPKVASPAPRADRFAAIEANPNAAKPTDVAPLDVSLLPSHEEQSAADIRKAIQAHKTDQAVDGFRATGLLSADKLTFHELVWLGQAAASLIDYESAELAFRKASERKAPPEQLGRARVMLARLLAERLNRKPEAKALLERVVAEQPGTPAAAWATEWLSAA